jgi:tetratricopeptide (TPR) repeat protein
MKSTSPDNAAHSRKAWLVKLALLAVGLGLGTWFLLSVLFPLKLPEDFPKLPDLQSQNQALRNMLNGADAQARSHPNSAEDIGRLGMVYHSNQFYEQAESAYKIALRLAPRDYRWPYCLALVKEESGREKEVLDLLQKTVQLKRDYIPALQKLADIYYKQDKLDEAARYYALSVSVAGGSSSLQAIFGLGRIAARRKDWSKVVEYVAPLSREYPHIRPPHQLLLDAYEALGQADKAAEERRNLLEPKLIVIPLVKDPLSEELLKLSCSSTRLLKEAGLLSRFGHPDQAIQVARRAVEVEPGDADARHFLARTLLETHGDKPEAVDEALAQLNEGLRLRPDDLLPLWYFTAFFFERDKTDAAVEQLRTMLAGNANRDDAHYYLGLVADRQGRTQEAVSQYQAALKSNPNNAEAYHKLGLILVTEGRLDEAIAYFQKAVHLNPMFTMARSNLGVALEQRGKTGQAMAQFVEALRLKPSDAATHMFLAMALLKSGRIEEAAEHFRETVRITPGEAQAHYGLGCALAMQGRPGEAAKELQEALRLRPDYAEPRDLLQKLEGKRE